MNTKISYLYRDACNYKMHNEVVILGILTKEQRRTILECLDEGENFVPSAVGLPEVKLDECDSEDDGPWFELGEDSFEDVHEKPTVSVTADELVGDFVRCKDRWYQYAYPDLYC